jgi:hypothetical protein
VPGPRGGLARRTHHFRRPAAVETIMTMISVPTETNPFLLQLVATGAGVDLPAAIAAADTGLRKRATEVRTKWGFPVVHGMSYALTNRQEHFSEPGRKSGTSATLAAWFHLNFDERVMTSLSHRFVGQVSTSVIEEYDVVFCEGY